MSVLGKKACTHIVPSEYRSLVVPEYKVNFSVHLQSLASKIFSSSKFFPNVWESWKILTRKCLLVDIFLTRRLSKSLAFCEFASVNFEPWTHRSMLGFQVST